MSRRTSIVKAITTKLNTINGQSPYYTNLFNNAYAKLKFWDEVNDFPSVYVTPGMEQREYHSSNFAWGILGVCIKVYCKGEDSQQQLENLLADIETCIDANRQLQYDPDIRQFGGMEVARDLFETTEILVQSITTDEGLLAPYAIGEINLQVRYQIYQILPI
jgi:hypothetical protein